MSSIEKRTISLPIEHAVFIDGMVESGAYASVSEVVRAGIRALQERDAAVTQWLLNEVAPVYDAMILNPSLGIPLDEVFDELIEDKATA